MHELKKYNFTAAVFAGVWMLSFFCGEHVFAQDKLYRNEFPLSDVTLLDGPFKKARDLNIKSLLAYDVDRLLAPYLKEAGLTPKAQSYKNWDGLDGHIGGHYLSALAMNYAATKDEACKKRLYYMLAELEACQNNNALIHPDWGIGYAGGVPNSQQIWSQLKSRNFTAFKTAWVPWYNVHKMYAGLRDAWLYTGNEKAKNIFLKFCDWAIGITSGLTDVEMQSMLDTEQGGMNEVLADAYQMTHEAKYLQAAKRFSHHMLLDPMSNGIDNLDNKHANTQVPKAIGFARIGELSHDEKFDRAGKFFWETVTQNRTLAFGGNSRREFFPSAASNRDFLTDVEGPESCNSYNMLKLTEDLFREEPLARYMDYYEKTVYNHILSTQNPNTGGYVYFTPVRPRSYKVYSTPNEAMWCCVGSGMENHGKYNEMIYTHQHDSLYVNLFAASELNWREKGIRIRQETRFPDQEGITLEIVDGSSNFTLLVRHPAWAADGEFRILVNGKTAASASHPSSYAQITRQWKKGDVVQVTFQMHNTIVHLPHVPNYVAIMHGPILLGAKTGTEDLKGLNANDSRWGHIPSGKKLPLDKAPIIIDDNPDHIAAALTGIKDQPLSFSVSQWKLINPADVKLEPFYRIHESRYMMYWMTLTNKQYRSYLDSLALREKEDLDLQNRTVDFVKAGEQQPEVDHHMLDTRSRTGVAHDQVFRETSDGGSFSYDLATNGEKNLSLVVGYEGPDRRKQNYEIYVDDVKLESTGVPFRKGQADLFDIIYQIPDAMIKRADHVKIQFKAPDNFRPGPVYYLRLIRAGK
ncbi:hypothetical protein BDD43_1941 [Mucilaginibacter gracilis]|uniref:Uncharacterized protein n=1 Tax=Mucilaginibacter gracilis TaxID=423350 RepID=A0A495IYJ8_9SPHI|nr:beta-L-arabinofuranosidase domain-containing protein [Mucilaginibacter gracilis]RKR81785.1 hypothetical protein BDD43_1941 [Mucilaginibacter gracilis]